MIDRLDKVDRLKFFSESKIYNKEVMEVMIEELKEGRYGEIYEVYDSREDKQLSLPVIVQEDKIDFIGHFVMPYLDFEWVAGEGFNRELLENFDLEVLDSKIAITDIMNLDYKEDIGQTLIMVTTREERWNVYEDSRKMQDRLKRIRDNEVDLDYKRITLKPSFELLEMFLGFFDNPYVDVIEKVYRVWHDEKEVLKAYGVFLTGSLVAVDYLLKDEKNTLMNGIMTPWYRNDKEIRNYEIGHYVIDKALDEIFETTDYGYFAIGSRADYKKHWETHIADTSILGKGRL